MTEIIVSLVFICYCVIGVVYSVRMENNKVLRQIHKVGSDHDWAERCFALGFAWPFAPIINHIVRIRNDHHNIEG